MNTSYEKTNGKKYIEKKSVYNSKNILIEPDDNFKSVINKKILIYKNNKLISDSEGENSDQDMISEENSDEELERELESKTNLPKNFGNKWTEKDKKKLLSYLIDSKKNISFELDDPLINKLAKKFSRSVGGIKAEIRRIVFEKYINGNDIENISAELNIIYRDVKQIIKLHLEKESENEINILEKENKLLKLRIENIKLRKELNQIQKN